MLAGRLLPMAGWSGSAGSRVVALEEDDEALAPMPGVTGGSVVCGRGASGMDVCWVELCANDVVPARVKARVPAIRNGFTLRTLPGRGRAVRCIYKDISARLRLGDSPA